MMKGHVNRVNESESEKIFGSKLIFNWSRHGGFCKLANLFYNCMSLAQISLKSHGKLRTFTISLAFLPFGDVCTKCPFLIKINFVNQLSDIDIGIEFGIYIDIVTSSRCLWIVDMTRSQMLEKVESDLPAKL